MQVDTRKIYVYHPDPGVSRAWSGIPQDAMLNAPGEKPLVPLKIGRRGGYDNPTFLQHLKAEDLGQFEYFGNPYNFNTKYVVDCEADDVIGSHITLASGKRVWVDMTAESVNIMCNRR